MVILSINNLEIWQTGMKSSDAIEKVINTMLAFLIALNSLLSRNKKIFLALIIFIETNSVVKINFEMRQY